MSFSNWNAGASSIEVYFVDTNVLVDHTAFKLWKKLWLRRKATHQAEAQKLDHGDREGEREACRKGWVISRIRKTGQ